MAEIAETIDDVGRPAKREAADVERGTSIGRYVVIERIGVGGMGVVHACYDPELDRKVAVKLLHPGRGGTSAVDTGHARLIREAQALARLNHRNVVAVHDVGLWAGRVYIAMEFVAGVTLGAWVRAQRRGWREVLDVYVQAGRGLAAAHDAGLVHRDFKPDNAMLGHDGRVRVMDFGIARFDDDAVAHALGTGETSAAKPELTGAGGVLGTPAYMAPEQYVGLSSDARSDQFSFAVALFEALYGHRPHRGSTMAELAFAVTEGRIVPVDRKSDVPTHLHRALLRALAVTADGRWASLPELLDALGRDVTRRRRRALAIGAAAIVVASVPIGQGVVARARARSCIDEGAAIEAVWGEAPAAAMQRALAATGSAEVEATWTRLRPWLDAYAREWATSRSESCRATEIDGVRSVELLALARECFDERRDALAALVTTLSDATERTIIDRAVSEAARLPRLGPCSDATWLHSRARPPRDPSVKASMLRVRTLLATARAAAFAGRYTEAVAAAREAADTAAPAGWAPLHAETLLEAGRFARLAGVPGQGEADLRHAFELALANAADELAADAGIALVQAAAAAARGQLGLVWAETCDALLVRLGQRDGLRGASLDNSLGNLLRVRGEFAEAAAHHTRALEVRERVLGPDHPDVAMSLHNLGNVWVSAGRFDAAVAPLEQAVAIHERTLGEGHPELAGTLTALANAYFSRGDVDGAAGLFERALAIREHALGPDHPDLAITLSNLAGVYFERGDYDAAAAMQMRSIAIHERARGPDHPFVGQGLVNLGRLHMIKGEYEQAVRVSQRALEISERKFGTAHPEVATRVEMLGHAVYLTGRYPEAAELLRRAVAMQEADAGLDHAVSAYALTWLALTELRLGNLDVARPLAERALAAREAGDTRPIDLATTRFVLARILGETDPARARALATAAKEGYAGGGPAEENAIQEIDAWLAAHE